MAAGGTDGASSIQVTVRVRPFTIREAAQLTRNDDGPLFLGDGSLASVPTPKLGQKGLRSVIKVMDEKCLVFDPPEDNPVQRFSRALVASGKRTKDQTFGFDRVFDENITQEDVYAATTKNLLDSVLDGYNATVFAYGATGCGKTHTITGTAQQPGIIFLTMQELFEKVGDLQEEKETEVTLSYLEIYNETIRDLLNPGAGGKQGLMLREDAHQAVSVAGLSSHKPNNVSEVMDMVIRGNSARTQSPTEANATSSRSHAVLQINVSLKDRNASTIEPVTMATLSIIDLAGSERASATKNRGERLLEGANINKSLLALGSCINALCDPRKKNHVPYRNSKLTRLLKFSLGGNCRTVMIVCVSPSSQHYDETQNTLRYANRAKNIQTKSVRNVYNVDRHVKDYLKKIDEQMNRINELTAQQKQYEELAFAKFRKAESKRSELAHEGIIRIRAAYDHSAEERRERINHMRRLRQVERRIGAISGWIGAFDQVCETREEEEPPASLVAMRKTAQGILVELEGSRQHFHQRLAKMNWARAVDTALQDGLRGLQSLDGATPDSAEEASLHKEVELLKSRAEIEAHTFVLEQDKAGEAGLMQVMLIAHFETIAILNQIMQMSEEEAIQAARDVLGKLLTSCTEATGQVIKPDGGLQIIEAVPPTRSGTPRKRKQVPLMAPSPIKAKIRRSPTATSASALPAHMAAEAMSVAGQMSGTPQRAMASPRRRVKIGSAKKGVAFSGTPKKKSPVKKRVVRWRDDTDEGGALVEFQETPKPIESTPEDNNTTSSSIADVPPPSISVEFDGEPGSSPLPPAPVAASEPRKTGTGRFATGFLSSKKPDVSPAGVAPVLSLGALASSDEETSPLREITGNSGVSQATHSTSSPKPFSHASTTITNISISDAENEPVNTSFSTTNTNSDTESNGTSPHSTFGSTKAEAQEIRKAMKLKRSSSLGVAGGHANGGMSGNTTHSRQRSRESMMHRRRSPTASGSPPSAAHRSHNRSSSLATAGVIPASAPTTAPSAGTAAGGSEAIFSASHARRMVRPSHSGSSSFGVSGNGSGSGNYASDDSLRSILSPRSAPITKGTGPVPVRRSLMPSDIGAGGAGPGVAGTPLAGGAAGLRGARMSAVVPGSASRASRDGKGSWR